MRVYFDNGIFAHVPADTVPQCDLGDLDPIEKDVHITLVSPKACAEHKERLQSLDWSSFQAPTPKFGVPAVCRDATDRVSLVAPVLNQDEFSLFVKRLAEYAGVEADPDRFFHLSLANNGGGHPLNSIGRITREHFPTLATQLAARRAEQQASPTVPSP